MPSDGVLQVSSIRPLQAGDISAVTLHPRLGIPLSLHTQPGQTYDKTHLHCPESLNTVFRPVSTDLRLHAEPIKGSAHKPQQIRCPSWDLVSAVLYQARIKTSCDSLVSESSPPATASVHLSVWRCP